MGRSTGFEPATPGTTNRCSNQLSYDRRDPWPNPPGKRLGKVCGSIRIGQEVTQATGTPLINSTIEKFGYPASLVREYRHWLVLIRPAQVTLGSLILAAKSDVTAFGSLPADAFAEQAIVIADIERALSTFCSYEKLNYLMLMMVDPHVHFHVVPRYGGKRNWLDIELADGGWPGRPDLKSAVPLSGSQMERMRTELQSLLV
jgi:diadenosine tetraphosphate (Ap4A) HIT family hydrolase